MKRQPIDVTVDPLWPIAYIAYREATWDGSYRILRDPSGCVREYGYDDGRDNEGIGVVVDLDADDEIIGLEIIHIEDSELVAIARDYAAMHGLDFPADIRAAARVLT